MSREPTAAGVIGLGAMGAPMAENLAHAGLLRGVWNRTARRARTLAGRLGVEAFERPADLARACRVIVVSVSADDALREVVAALGPGARPGLVVADTSTVAPATARQAAQRLAASGAGFLDTPVSGGVEGARQGTLVMFAGGGRAHLDTARPVLAALAARVVHVGPVGAGQQAKAVNQVMAAGINQAVSEALALGEALGLPMDRLVEVYAQGAAGSWFLRHRGPSMLAGDYRPGFRIALHHKDLELCQALMAELQRGPGETRLPLVEMTRIHYERLIRAGHGDEDISALIRLKRALFAPRGKEAD